MSRSPLVAIAALVTLAASSGAACSTSRSAGPASNPQPVADAPRQAEGAEAPAKPTPEGARQERTAGDRPPAREFQLQKSETARHAHGERPSEMTATRTHAAMRFFVVDPDAGPIAGIVIKMTAPDGTRYFTGETDSVGYGEVLVPIGQRYEVEYLSLGRRNVTAHVDVPAKPNQNIRLTLRYRPWRGRAEGGATETPEQPKERRFLLEGVVFESGSATLKRESYPRLDSVVEYMTHKPSARIQVSGHTDNVGNARKNQALSEARAKAVRDYLVAQGIDGGRVEAVGYGDQRPVASNDTEEGRQRNRRIEAVEVR